MNNSMTSLNSSVRPLNNSMMSLNSSLRPLNNSVRSLNNSVYNSFGGVAKISINGGGTIQ